MALQITKRKMEISGKTHERIAEVEWINPETGNSGRSSRASMYNWIKDNNGQAYVEDKSSDKAYVGTRENEAGTKYIQTYSDGIWNDNLLALPEFF
jgi:hypothetical protein